MFVTATEPPGATVAGAVPVMSTLMPVQSVGTALFLHPFETVTALAGPVTSENTSAIPIASTRLADIFLRGIGCPPLLTADGATMTPSRRLPSSQCCEVIAT